MLWSLVSHGFVVSTRSIKNHRDVWSKQVRRLRSAMNETEFSAILARGLGGGNSSATLVFLHRFDSQWIYLIFKVNKFIVMIDHIWKKYIFKLLWKFLTWIEKISCLEIIFSTQSGSPQIQTNSNKKPPFWIRSAPIFEQTFWISIARVMIDHIWKK